TMSSALLEKEEQQALSRSEITEESPKVTIKKPPAVRDSTRYVLVKVPKRHACCCGTHSKSWIKFIAAVRLLISIIALLVVIGRNFPFTDSTSIFDLIVFLFNALNTGLLWAAAYGKNGSCIVIYVILEAVFLCFFSFILVFSIYNNVIYHSEKTQLRQNVTLCITTFFLFYIIFFTFFVANPYYTYLKDKRRDKQQQRIVELRQAIERNA
ncbi:hypothetical protein PFISCL1PPCAC_4893, partial [Pristionchus fissidentatus]